ncbi:MAG: hypothetical protein KA764_05160 [Anaerolineales bacterium]|nr:hypothetical protein [Anaerolineales bacterium]
MFDSIKRGFSFVGQALDMARKDLDLIKPSLYGMVVGAIASALGAIPIILAALTVGGSDFGNIVIGILGALLVFVQYAIAYVFSGMTAYLVYGYLTEGDGRLDKAWEIIRRDWLDILSLAGASTLVKVVENFIRGNGRRRNPLGEMLAGLLNSVWTSATYFVLPAMVIEDLNLGQGLKRATEIVKKNLMLVAITEIGVSGVIGFAGGVLGFLAVILGVGIFLGFAAAAGSGNVVPLIIGGVLAALVAGSLLAVISAFSSYVMTAYHTCMFLWARGAEQAVAQGQSVQAAPVPAPVAAVLGLAGR